MRMYCIVCYYPELSTSCVLQANINTTFLVELINTSGDKFVNINEEVHKGTLICSFYKCV